MFEIVEAPVWYLMVIYILGAAACMWLGFQMGQKRKHGEINMKIQDAYNRGWDVGHGFRDKIMEEKISLDSAVRILTGDHAGLVIEGTKFSTPFDWEELDDGPDAFDGTNAADRQHGQS